MTGSDLRPQAYRARSLQRRFAAGGFLRQLDLGHRNEDLGAGLEIGGLEERLLLGAAVGTHHCECIDQCLIGRALDPIPMALEMVRLEKIGERAQHAVAIDGILALARGEIVDERIVAYATLAVRRRGADFLLDTEAGDAGELEEIAAVSGFGELGDSPDTADFV